MSALAWGFAAMGAAAAVPVIFHLIRQPTRERTEFGSLMFLTPTPPRLDRRSRIGDWLLLILRCLALLAIVAAFIRPYWPDPAVADDVPERTIVLLDTSASMARGDLLERAAASVSDLPDGPAALWTFDRSVREVVPPDAPRSALLRAVDEVAGAGASSAVTELDTAIMQAADRLRDDDGGLIVVLSDFQQGASIDRLQAFDWPAGVRVELRPLGIDAGNATLTLLPDSPDAAGQVRLRITNHDAGGRFTLDGFGGSMAVEVPPGESHIVSLDEPTEPAKVTLAGDEATFDNTAFIAPSQARTVRIRNSTKVGSSRDDANAVYYLRRAIEASGIETVVLPPVGRPTELALVAQPLNDVELSTVNRSLKQGGTAIVLLQSPDDAAALADLVGPTEPFEGPAPDDRLIARLDFTSDLLAPFRGPGYNDFSDVRFFRAIPVQPSPESDADIVAWFDDGLPAIWIVDRWAGRVVVFTSGWTPEWSQLALASKFVPLVMAMLPPAAASGRVQVEVGERVQVATAGSEVTVQPPEGDAVMVEDGWFDQADRSGFYTVTSPGGDAWTFGVNIASREGRTLPLDPQRWVELGLPVEEVRTPAESRTLRERELEQRQKLWKWAIRAALVLLGLEMTWAGWRVSQARRTSKTGRPA